MRAVSLAVLMVLVLAAAAQAGVVTLQNGVAGYTGCEDTWLGYKDGYGNSGVAWQKQQTWYDDMRAFAGLGNAYYKSLVRFNAIPLSPGTTVTSAKLHLHKCYGQSAYTYGSVTAYKALHTWVDGQGGTGHVDQNWTTDSLSGANADYWNAATQLGKGTKTPGYTYVYQNPVPAGITIDHAQHGSVYEATMFVEEASIAAVDANDNSWYHDTTNNILYFRDGHAGVFDSTGMSYYTPGDRWGATAATGAGDIDLGSALTGDWPDGTAGGSGYVNITAFVQEWVDSPSANHGVLLTAGSGEIGWRMSEWSTQAQRPYLEIEYEAGAGTIPEPAGLGMIGIALLALRRRKRRSSTLLRRPAMKAKALLMVLTGGLLVALTGTASAGVWELPDDTTLAVDFGPTEPPNETAEPGWASFHCGVHSVWEPGPYSHVCSYKGNDYTVTVSAADPSGQFSGLELRARRGTSPVDAGDLSWGDVYNDHVFTYYTMWIKIEGLAANHTYEKLYLLSIGGGGAGGRVSKMWLSMGSPSTPVLHTVGAAEPIANDDSGSIMELANPTTTALGELEMAFTTNPGSSVSSWTNGFILVDYPADAPIPEPAGLGLLGLALLGLRRRRRTMRTMSVVLAACVLALAGTAGADTVLSGHAYLDGAGNLKYVSGGATIATTGGAETGTRSDPYVFTFGAQNLDLNGYNIQGAINQNADQYSAKYVVGGNVLNGGGGGGGSFLSYANGATNGNWGGTVHVEASGSVNVNTVRTDSSYQAGGDKYSGDIYLKAENGPVIVNGYLSTWTEGPGWQHYNSGNVTVTSSGAGAQIQVNGTIGGESIRTDGTGGGGYLVENAGDARLYTPGNVTLAGGIDAHDGYGHVTVRGDGGAGTRAGDVVIGGSIDTFNDAESQASGSVSVTAHSLTVNGNIDARGQVTGHSTWYSQAGNVTIDCLEDVTIDGAVYAHSLQNQYRSPPGQVSITGKHIALGEDGSGVSINTSDAYPGTYDTSYAQYGDADVTLQCVDTSGEPFLMSDPLGGPTSSVDVAGRILTGANGTSSRVDGDVYLYGVEVHLGDDVLCEGNTNTSIDVHYGVTEHGPITHLMEDDLYGHGAHNITYTGATPTFTADVPHAEVIPEPASLTLMGLALVAVRRRRK